MTTTPTVLVVGDDLHGIVAAVDGFYVHTATTATQARALLEQEWVQVVTCGTRVRDTDGIQFLAEVRRDWPEVIRVLVAEHCESTVLVRALNEAGIYQYILPPWQPEQLRLTLHNAVQWFKLQRQNELLAIQLRLPSAVPRTHRAPRGEPGCDDDGIVRTADSPMTAVCERLQRVAPYDIPVLLTGESGTGKELAARALHNHSQRRNQPFIVENCNALSEQLLESELFGHKKGAFTGASEDRTGLFERANGGTLFLDEIGEVSPSFQVKLLRVIQEGELRPIGSARTYRVDARMIAATNKNLQHEVSVGHFREDLYYRLAAVTVHLPPLRERRGDIPVLARALLDVSMQNLGKYVSGYSAEALLCMQRYPWPGNVRELRNEIQHMLVMADRETLGVELLSPHVARAAAPHPCGSAEPPVELTSTLKQRIESLELCILRETLARHRGNKSRAAEELGLSRVGLRAKLERHGLTPIVIGAAPRKRRGTGLD